MLSVANALPESLNTSATVSLGDSVSRQRGDASHAHRRDYETQNGVRSECAPNEYCKAAKHCNLCYEQCSGFVDVLRTLMTDAMMTHHTQHAQQGSRES